jgi:hypothetical protein
MAARPEPPDLKNWSTLPWRVRIAGVYELAGWGLIGVALVAAVIPLATAALLFAVHLLSLVGLFSSRRPWWPPEPTIHDPLAANGRLLAAVGVGLIAATILLVAAGILHF